MSIEPTAEDLNWVAQWLPFNLGQALVAVFGGGNGSAEARVASLKAARLAIDRELTRLEAQGPPALPSGYYSPPDEHGLPCSIWSSRTVSKGLGPLAICTENAVVRVKPHMFTMMELEAILAFFRYRKEEAERLSRRTGHD